MSTTPRRRRVLLAACAAPALALLAVPAAAAPATTLHAEGPLRDLSAAADATDGASARVVAVSHGGGSTVVLHVDGLARDAAGTTFGAHVHVGPCVAGDGAAAGPHYNHDVATGDPTPQVSPQTEVWLDLTVRGGGTATSVAHVPFRIAPGDAASVVVHAEPTAPSGAAGARLACLPVRF